MSDACNNFFISVKSGIRSIADLRPLGIPFMIYFHLKEYYSYHKTFSKA